MHSKINFEQKYCNMENDLDENPEIYLLGKRLREKKMISTHKVLHQKYSEVLKIMHQM